jgi:hypothetical protein
VASSLYIYLSSYAVYMLRLTHVAVPQLICRCLSLLELGALYARGLG